jgi:biopolymer transport protein ExbD
MGRLKQVESEENVACNLIPMIDIMFLLLLFFMLSADMSQRVTEDIKLPVADMVKEDPKQEEGYKSVTVNLVSENDVWFVKIAGHSYQDWGQLRQALHEFAQAEPELDNAPGAFFSRTAIMLRAESEAPYKEVQRLIQLCSKVGLYKIEVVATKPSTPDKV